jgi:PAS domain S-box-containing protein
MARIDSNSNFADCLTVGQAASYLGVSTATLRNWDRSGKLKPRRHPQNGYRIYLHEDLEGVLRSADLSTRESPFVPRADWSEMRESDHFVQFYENDEFLVDSITGFVAAALEGGNSSLVVATLEHRIAIQRNLTAAGVGIAAAIEAGRYVVLDAADTLAKFIVDGVPNERLFMEHFGGVMAKLAHGGRRVHAFGEMVSLLWAEGNRHAAIRLEELWNELGKSHRFVLFCAYPLALFGDESHAVPFNGICACHTRVIPAESYADIDSADERLRAVTRLQQKAQALEAEIAHRTEVEKTLAKRERELADFLEHSTVGLHKVGPDGTILWANRADYELLGYTFNEYVGHSIIEFHADPGVVADMLDRLHRGETFKDFPARLRSKDGSIKHVLVNSSACFENGKFAYTRCFTRDVTQQYLAEQALREADRRKDHFLATLAHELRNPLAPIQQGLEVLRIDSRDERLREEAHSMMERQVQLLARLVDDLLDVTRIARDKMELRKEPVELADIVRNAVETSRPWVDSAGHHLSVTLPERPMFLDADPTRMAQVFSNLLNNSAKYTEGPQGRIEIEARLDGSNAVVAVRDNGLGISRESLATVFDMFRQAEQSVERAQGGLGIGLALVRRLVELHGGTINAHSDGPGKGSEFTVRLPLSSTEAARVKTPLPPGDFAAVRHRILVVDDNKDAAHTLSMLLRVKGHQVRIATSGLQALQIAPEFLPQLILMDIGMPHPDGLETTRRLRKLPCGQDVMIVALTGWGQPDDVRRSIDAGCSAHVVKPVEFSELELLLAQLASSPARAGTRG